MRKRPPVLNAVVRHYARVEREYGIRAEHYQAEIVGIGYPQSGTGCTVEAAVQELTKRICKDTGKTVIINWTVKG